MRVGVWSGTDSAVPRWWGPVGASGDGDVEGRAGHVLLAPLDHQEVLSALLQQVGDAVVQVARVFDLQLLAGHLGSADAHQEHVLPWRRQEETHRVRRRNGF